MATDKANIIKSVLDGQADELEARIERARREANEYSGAEQVLTLLAKQMPSFAAEIEKRIDADTEMGGETANKVRVYVKNVIARFQTMCTDNARNQYNSKLRAEGQIPLLKELGEQMRARGVKEVAVAARREEVEAEQRAKHEADMKEKAERFKQEADASDAAAEEAKEAMDKIMAGSKARAADTKAKEETKEDAPPNVTRKRGRKKK